MDFRVFFFFFENFICSTFIFWIVAMEICYVPHPCYPLLVSSEEYVDLIEMS